MPYNLRCPTTTWQNGTGHNDTLVQCSAAKRFQGTKLHIAQSYIERKAGSTGHKAVHGTMPYNLQCFTTTRQNAPHRIQWGFLSRPYSYNTGAPVPFPHMIQRIPIPCYLTGYRDSCPLSSQATRIPSPSFRTGSRSSCLFPCRIQQYVSFPRSI
jgi:hypothetical protein